MRDHLEVLLCDEEGCDAELAGPARLLLDRAEAAGWQVSLLLARYWTEDDGWEERTDRCPDHHVTRDRRP
ncbi:hypothetical protein [Marinactinospora rubrisoli]|uniref:Uncharacterized protein n=1 Tax=Marinactinospora rubrisoli TaxID=2715399 RepID=A0ABW2KQF2_9ACTN